MSPGDSLLIIGAGHAGAELAFAARQQGWTGAITLLGDEGAHPYHRPPLSKTQLAVCAAGEPGWIRPPETYAKLAIEFMPGVRVARVARDKHHVVLQDGRMLPYSKLALCTGGRPRLLNVEGLDAGAKPRNLHYLRTHEDAAAIREQLKPDAKVVIIGGGYIGLEVAASARKAHAEVTVLEAAPRVLARVTGPQMSAFYQQIHEDAGVRIVTGAIVQRVTIDAAGAITSVVCPDGVSHAADLVVAGIGMLPNVELAVDAGLEVAQGIVVDASSTTSDPDIYAAGDCTAQHSALYGRSIRLESVPNALEQARAAAAALCGAPKPNHAVPWFWSDQYDLKLQMAGLSDGHDTCVVRGSVTNRRLCAFYLKDGVLIAADAVNQPADFMQCKRALQDRVAVDAAALADDAVPLKSLLAPQPAPAHP
jgi:3-phenylpropionate/trans-cinnamate dioxygenase ferredoxin reductase subunit